VRTAATLTPSASVIGQGGTDSITAMHTTEKSNSADSRINPSTSHERATDEIGNGSQGRCREGGRNSSSSAGNAFGRAGSKRIAGRELAENSSASSPFSR